MSFIQSIFASIALIVASFFGLSSLVPAPVTPVAQTATSTKQSVNDDTVLLERKGTTYEMNIVTKELTPYISPVDDIKAFTGLPKEQENTQISINMGRILLSADKTKTIVVFSTFDKTKEPSGFDGSLPVVKADEFVCDIATKKCEATDSLEVAYKAVFGEVGEWFKGGMLQWYQWDSKKNILFGHLNGEGVGAASPVYVFNLNTRILQQTLGFNSLNNQEKRAGVPSGAFSPSLNEFVMVYSTGNTWSLLLYRSDDLTTPQKKYDISSMIDAGAEEVRSVAWSADEKNIVLSTTDQIYTFSLESGKSVLRYTDPAHSLYDPVQLSRSEKYIVFVNYLKATFYFEANQRITVLRTVDLQNNNKISELLVEDGLGLNNIP